MEWVCKKVLQPGPSGCSLQFLHWLLFPNSQDAGTVFNMSFNMSFNTYFSLILSYLRGPDQSRMKNGPGILVATFKNIYLLDTSLRGN